MNAVEKKPPPLYCSFCGKSEDDVLCIVAGPTVFICDECTEVAHAVVEIKKAEMPTAKIVSG